MNVWNKVLMVLVTILCVVFGVLAANKYSLTKQKEGEITKLQGDLDKLQGEVQQLRYEIYGGPEKIAETWRDLGLDGQLTYLRNLQNGEAFPNCTPVEARVDEETATAAIAFGVDPNHATTAFRAGSVAFVFDSGSPVVKSSAASDDAGSEEASEPADSAESAEVAVSVNPYTFLGAFKVSGATDNQVKLDSIGNFSAEELDALKASARSGNSWVVYADRLPIDSPADVAYFESERPEFAKSLPAEIASFVSKTLTLDDVQSIGSGNELAANARMPVDFQGELESNWETRDRENVLAARNTLALNTLTSIIADQFVSIGDDVEDEEVLAFENWDQVYAAAKARKKVESWRENIVKTQAAVERMNGFAQLVADKLANARSTVDATQKAIDKLLVDNANKAAKIAQFQFMALEKAESASQTVSNDKVHDSDI